MKPLSDTEPDVLDSSEYQQYQEATIESEDLEEYEEEVVEEEVVEEEVVEEEEQ